MMKIDKLDNYPSDYNKHIKGLLIPLCDAMRKINELVDEINTIKKGIGEDYKPG